MKTLVKPRVDLNSEIFLNKSYRQNRPKSHKLQYRKFYIEWKILLITMSFFTCIIFCDSPEIDGDICNKFNHKQICNVW